MATHMFSGSVGGWQQAFRRLLSKTSQRRVRRHVHTESLESRVLLAATLELDFDLSTVSEGMGENAITATLVRVDPSDITAALTVVTSADDTDELAFPATVTIPANETSTTFQIDTINDALVDGTAAVTLTVTAVSYAPGTASVSVTDDDTATQKIIGGQLDGTLLPDTYAVSHSIIVAAGQQLTLSPGSKLQFSGGQRLEVTGQLVAEGTSSSQIAFTSASESPASGDWNGLLFRNNSVQERSTLDHAVVEYAATAVSLFGQSGPVTITSSVIRHNSGSGIRVIDDNTSTAIVVTGNRIHNNATEGVYASASGSGCNSGSTSITLANNEIDHNGTVGVRLSASGSSSCIIGPGAGYNSSIVTGNRIHSNLDGITAHASHGGRRGGVLTPTIQNNFVYDNLNDGIQLTSNTPSNRIEPIIVNNTIVRNGGTGFSHPNYSDPGLQLFNNLIADNATGVQTEPGYDLLDGTLGYNNVSGNAGGNWINYPEAVGTPTTTNANGTEADNWSNISVAADFKSDGLHILAGSPLVDAGTDGGAVSVPILDFDGQMRDTPPDIGADEVPDSELSLTTEVSDIAEDAGTASLTVTRRTSTGQPLTVHLASSDTSELTVPTTVVIAAGRTSETVEFSVLEDGIVDGTQAVKLTATAADHYDGSAVVTVRDVDVPSLLMTVSATSFSENAGTRAATVTVSRNTPALDDLTISLSSDDTSGATVDSTVVIPAGQTSVSADVAAVDDAAVDGTQVVTLTAAADGHLSAAVSVSVTDDESRISITAEHSSVLESAGDGATNLTVTRNSDTANDLAVTLTVSDATEARIPIGGFSSPDLALAVIPAGQTSVVVPVRAIDDSVVDGDRSVTITGTADGHQAGLAEIIVLDDDVAEFGVVESEASTQVDEDGTITDSLTVVLKAQPISDVIIRVDVDDNSLVNISPDELIFRSVNWHIPQTITLTGTPDEVVDGDQTAIVSLSVDRVGSDTAFANAPGQDVTVTVTDGDAAGLTLSKMNALVSESGTTDSFSVVLPAAPVSDVVVLVVSEDESEVMVDPTRLTFTPASWNMMQTVTLSGNDDPLVDTSTINTVTVSIDAAASDDAFDELPEQVLLVTNEDDDMAGFTVSTTGTSVSESGTTFDATIVLTAAPVSTVVFDVVSQDTTEVSVQPSRVTFTADTWNTPQTITLTGVNDDEVDGSQTSIVSVRVDSDASDSAFAALENQELMVTTTDDDVAAQSGDVDGDDDFDANDSFLIHLVKLSGSDLQISQSKGSSVLPASEIRAAVSALATAADVDGDGDFDANDSFLIHLVKLSGSDAQIAQSKGSSALSAAEIRTRASSLNPPSRSAGRVTASASRVMLSEPTQSTDLDRLFADSDSGPEPLLPTISNEPVAAGTDAAAVDFRSWIDVL